MPTSTQRFRLVGEDDASRAFLTVAAASKLLSSNMSDASTAAAGLTRMIGASSLIPVAAGATAAIASLGTALGAAGGALSVFGLSAGGIFKDMLKQQKAINVTDKSLSSLTKGTAAYTAKTKELNAQQKAFNQQFGPAAKGFDNMKASFERFKTSTGPVTTGVLGKGFQLVADVLPKLVPVSNAAGKAVGGLISDLSKWTEGPAFAHLLHFLETSGPKDITAFGHSIGNVLSGLGGFFGNFVGAGDHAAASLERLTSSFAKWGHSQGVSASVKSFLKYVSDNGPQLSSTFKSLADIAPRLAGSLGQIGSLNLSVTSKFLSLVAGLPQKQFTLIADGLFAIAAGSKAVAAVNGLVGAGAALVAIGKGGAGILAGKGIAGKAAGAAGGLGVQKVYVVNMGPGGLGGDAATAEKGIAGAIAAVGWRAAGAALAKGFLADIGPAGITAGNNHNENPHTQKDAVGNTIDLTKRGPGGVQGQAAFLAAMGRASDAVDALKGRAQAASRALDEIGQHGQNSFGKAAAAVKAFSGRGTALDSIQAQGAAASRSLDQIGPHAQSTSSKAVAAIKSVTSILATIHDQKVAIRADTTAAMSGIAAVQRALNAIDKIVNVHVNVNRFTNANIAGVNTPAPPAHGTKPGTGKLFAGGGGSSAVQGRDYMPGLLKGIAGGWLSAQNALSKVANAISNARTTVANLKGIRSGFRSTFGADSIFAHDFSHTVPGATTTINGVATTGPDTTSPGTIADVLKFQTQQRNKARSLNRDVKKVLGMGLSKALVRQLEAQGATGAATLHALAQGDRSQIARLNSLNKQTSASLASAGMRAGNYVRGGSVNADIRNAQKADHVLELLEHHLKHLIQSEKKGETIVVNIDGEAFITAVKRRNHRKGVKTAGM